LTTGLPIVERLENCANDLRSWNKANKNDINQELESCRRELEWCCNHGGAAGPVQLTNLGKRMTQLMIQEDKYWRQWAKTHWYKDGDLNTKKISCFGHYSKEGKSDSCLRKLCW